MKYEEFKKRTNIHKDIAVVASLNEVSPKQKALGMSIGDELIIIDKKRGWDMKKLEILPIYPFHMKATGYVNVRKLYN